MYHTVTREKTSMKNTALFYMNYTAPYLGNFLASMLTLVKRLQGKNINSHFIFPESAQKCYWVQKLTEAGITVSFMPADFSSKCRFMRKIFKNKNIMFIHLHFTDDITERLLMKFIMFVCHNKRPIVVHYHNHYFCNTNRVKQSLKKIIMHGDYLLGCSAGVAESLQTGRFRNNIDFVENAVDFSRLKSSRNGYNQYNFLQFGFDYERKGVDLSLEAFQILRKKYDNLTLSIGLASNRQYVETKITEKFGTIPAWIKLLEPTENIAAYYDNACAFLSPSREEGFCYSAVEAAYCGCPVIASDISGQNGIKIPDIIWCKTENSSDLAEKIDSYLCMAEEEKYRLSSRMKASAAKYYDLNRWTEQMITYYEKRNLLAF